MRRFALALILVPVAAAAEDRCADLVKTADMAACYKAEWQSADAELNDAYRAARSYMRRLDTLSYDDFNAAANTITSGAGEPTLRAAQASWINFRDNTCKAEGYGYHGGTMEQPVIFACLSRVTAIRAQELRQMVPEE